jgi:hypothetical protein
MKDFPARPRPTMGGGQALNFGLGHPDAFGWIGAFSPAPNPRRLAELLPDPKTLQGGPWPITFGSGFNAIRSMSMVGQGPLYGVHESNKTSLNPKWTETARACWCSAAFKKDMARAEQFIGYDTTRCLRLASKSIRDSWRHNGSCRQREALERQLVA